MGVRILRFENTEIMVYNFIVVVIYEDVKKRKNICLTVIKL